VTVCREFADPRLAVPYDALGPDRRDTDFSLALAADLAGGELLHSQVHYRFLSSGEELISPNELRFRARATLTRQLRTAWFSVQHVYGDWDRRPAGPRAPEMIFIALRR
jgi:hypothetical protein